MRIAVIGGTGHMGTYMIPRLVQEGHEVICVSRGKRAPYADSAAWKSVRMVVADRGQEEKAGTFGKTIASLEAEVVVDLICFRLESAQHLVESLRGRVAHFLSCGTITVHGHATVVPTRESDARTPVGDYGIRKAAIESYLLTQARTHGFPATVVHPGIVTGPGWAPINPQANFDLKCLEAIARGDEICLPNLGLETLHHVHAEDVAQVFCRAITHWRASVGESFHAVSDRAVTLRGYAEQAARWFGKEPKLSFLPLDQWRAKIPEADAKLSVDLITHSYHCSNEKARGMLGYEPRYTALDAVFESIEWLIRKGDLSVGSPRAAATREVG